MTAPRLSIVITAHNEAAHVAGTLAALNRQEGVPGGVEIVLVDDRSTDGTAERGIAPRREDLAALRKAATSGNKKFFLGTDSAPHARASKESACGCAGCYSAPYALGLYAEVFEAMDALHQLEGFASLHGPAFYRLPVNSDKLKLVKRTARIPETLPYSEPEGIVPLAAGNTLDWQVLVD